MSLKEKIMPPLVLTIICVISSALLAFVYNLTYVDTTGIITDKLSAGLTEIYGNADGFSMQMNEDGTVKTFEGVTSIISDSSGNVSFEITADGYSKGGLHLLIGFDESGSVCGISVLSIGETPGLGTRAAAPEYLGKFTGITSPEFEADAITGATFSSKGIQSAVKTAVTAYLELKGDDAV